MERLYEYVPQSMVTFLLVTLFSLFIGLSLRRLNLNKDTHTLFGTDRTFTFIGILGYLLYILDPVGYRLYLGGGLLLGLLLCINYYGRLTQHQQYGITTIVIALITYALPPIVSTQPSWFYIMVVVAVLLLAEMKETFGELAQRMQNDEMITLAKFLAISGIILPILPQQTLVAGISLSPYTVWLATVVVSGISYLSYLLRRYVFRDGGILISGIVGGLYSSTATISVLARQAKTATVQQAPEYVGAMLMSVSVMFLRFLILIAIFSRAALLLVAPYLLVLSVLSALMGWQLYRRARRLQQGVAAGSADAETSNPLEFKVAIVFALLFVVFTVVTHFTLIYAGNGGLNILSVVAGLSDITPFILNLLENTQPVGITLVAACSMQAILSNICVNLCYALFFSSGNASVRRLLLRGFGSVIAANALLLIAYYLI